MLLRRRLFGGGAATYLLDSYPGAQFAFSTKKLSSTYTGPLIQVYSSVTTLTTDVSAGSNGLISESTLTSLASGGNLDVVTFYDQSGNSRNGTKNASYNAPRIVNSGVVVKDGDDIALDFSRSRGTGLDFSHGLSSPEYFSSFIKFNAGGSTGDNYYEYIMAIPGDSTTDLFAHGFRSHIGFYTVHNNVVYYYADSGVPFGTSTVGSWFWKTTTTTKADLYLGGTLHQASSTPTSNVGGTTSIIGRRDSVQYPHHYTGKISTIIGYPSDQEANRSGIVKLL